MEDFTNPTREQLAKLTRWAQVAFAARCVRRVLSLLNTYDLKNATQTLSVLSRLARVAEDAAAKSKVPPRISEPKLIDILQDDGQINDIALAACSVADLAFGSASAKRGNLFAAETLFFPPGLSSDALIAQEVDFQLLCAAQETQSWTDDTPVPPELFGPLWPFGKPEGCPEDEVSDEPAREPKLLLEFTVPDDADDDEVARLVEEATKRASDLHIAHGGAGLVVDDLQIHSPAPVPEEAPVG